MTKHELKILNDAFYALGNSRDFIYFSEAKEVPWSEDKQLLENTKVLIRLKKLIAKIENEEEKPIKPWIGLTGDEIDEIYFSTDDEGEAIELTEAKLREKNSV